MVFCFLGYGTTRQPASSGDQLGCSRSSLLSLGSKGSFRGSRAQHAVAMPLQVLRMLGRHLEREDLAAARLVCQEWREQLSAQVQLVQLPSQLWQYCVPGQVVGLYRALDSFRHLQEVRLRLVPQHPVDSWSMSRAADTLYLSLPSLRRLEVSAVMQAGHWRALLASIQCLAPQLTGLALLDICWPPLDTMHLLASFSNLRALSIASPHFSRLESGHLDAIGRLQQLRALRLCFRTVTGTAASPLSLDALSLLVRLTQLDVQYTGLLELSSAVVFCRPAALAALTNLQTLSVCLIPMPSLAALSQLPQLLTLELQQAQPLSGSQCSALARCQGLSALSLSSVQWGDLPHLAPLSSLTSLSVQVWQPARGSLPGGAAGQQVLALTHLCGLQHLQLRGQCELSAALLGRLAGHWRHLTSLDLCCVLPDGTQGLQHFTALRSLKLRPYKWDVWSSEPPVLLYPSLLPPSLSELQALDVWCVEEPPPPPGPLGAGTGAGSAYTGSSSSSYSGITGILTGMSSVGRELCGLGSNMPGGGPLAAAAAAAHAEALLASTGDSGDGDGDDLSSSCSGSGSGADEGDVDALAAAQATPGQQLQQQQQQQQQAPGSGLVLCMPHLRRLVLRSTSPFDRRLMMPDFSACSQLECLELHHSQLNQCHVQHIAAACPASLRSLKLVAVDDGARIRASGLTILTQLSALTSLSVHAHERAINKNVRRAIASMSQLRTLTLLTSPDYPSAFARNLACLTQLTNLMVLRVGLGFGALDALRRLGSHVSKALPHCSYQMLTDGSCD